jgi:cytochrome d ubiquinol oxidase subunit II
MKTGGEVQARARRLVLPLWGLAVVLLIAVVASSFVVRPGFTGNFGRWPWLLAVPLMGMVAAAAVPHFHVRNQEARTFFASAALIAGTLGSAAAGLYPHLLPSLAGSPHPGLDIYNTASSPRAQSIALTIYLIGMAIVAVYLVNVYRVWRGKVGEEHTYKV